MTNKGPKVTTDTRMYHEAQSASRVVARQLIENEGLVEEIGRLLRERQPQVVVTCARGSSDHAATYGKYLIETFAGIPTASFAPSVSSVYAAKQNMRCAVFLALSQSGKSPDLLTSARAAKEAGALVIALVNVVDSQLAELADEVVPLHAGPETSVAATKSYIATLAALAQLVAAWTQSDALKQALSVLPAQLEEAWSLDWQPAVNALEAATNFFVIARGVGLGPACTRRPTAQLKSGTAQWPLLSAAFRYCYLLRMTARGLVSTMSSKILQRAARWFLLPGNPMTVP